MKMTTFNKRFSIGFKFNSRLNLGLILICSFFAQTSFSQWSQVSVPAPATNMIDIDFTDANHGMVARVGGAEVSYTNDGGQTWSNSPSVGPDMYRVHRFDANNLFVVGAGGAAYKSTNGGSSWTSMQTIGGHSHGGIVMLSPSVGLRANLSGTIFRTTNGGASWSTVYGGGFQNIFLFSRFSPAFSNVVYQVGQSRIMKTTNSGSSWSQVGTASSGGFSCIDCIDANTCWVGGNGSLIYKTTNGGASWTTSTKPGSFTLNDIDFVDANNGWLVGGAGMIYKTTDGGATWTQEASGTTATLYGLDMVDASVGYISGSGGVVLKYAGAPAAGEALNLDGSNDYVNLGSSLGNFGTNNFTIETWFNTTNPGVWASIIGKRPICNYSNMWNITFYGGAVKAEICNSTNQSGFIQLSSGGGLNDGNWHHVALVRQSNQLRLYIDGTLVQTGASSVVSNISNSANLEIGHNPCGYFNGSVDDVRIWNYARSASEIAADMNHELCGNESGLIGYYDFNEGTAGANNAGQNTLYDETSNGNNGTLYNFALNGNNSNWVAPGGVASGSASNCNSCPDADDDGYTDAACGGEDCDDSDPSINPDATELCDGIDNNCDGNIDEGLTDPIVSILELNVPAFCQGLVELKADISNLSALQTPITYAWSNGATTESIIVTAGGTYSVDVTEGGGCSGSDDHDVTTNAWDVLGSYVMVGDEVDIDGNTVSGGGVGVTGAGEKARIRGGSVVNEFVKAPVISVSGGSSVGHKEFGQVTVGLPTFKSSNHNSDDITVSSGSSMTLSGTAYGEIEVKKNATLTFSAAEIHIEDLEVEDGGTIVFSQDAELMIDDDMKLNEDCSFNTAGKFVVVYVGDRTTIDEGSDVVARIYSVDKLHVKKAKSSNHTTMTGMFISDDKVDGDDYVDWNWDANCGSISSSNMIAPEIDEFEVIDANIISSEEGLSEPALNIFPNPARDILNIQLDNIEEGKVMIFDSMGRLVWERDLSNGQMELSANLDSRFQNGLYVVSLISKEHRIAKRLVISK